MSRANRYNVAVLFGDGVLSHYVPQDEATRLLAQDRVVVTQYGGAPGRRRIKAVQIKLPAPPPSDSATTPTTLTLNDMLANVGQAPDGFDNISPSRIAAAQAKVIEWATPSWADRLVASNAECTA